MAPRTAAQNEQIRTERRAHILHSALALFARHGYASTSVRMIAQEAGVAQGLMYRYFASKEELLRAVVELFRDEVLTLLSSTRTSADPHTQVVQIIRRSFDLIQQRREVWQLFYAVRSQLDVVTGMRADIQDFSVLVLAALEAPFRAAGVADPATEARLLFAIIDGVCQQYVLVPEHYPLAQVTDRVLRSYAWLPASA